jgi:hypothetical protein
MRREGRSAKGEARRAEREGRSARGEARRTRQASFALRPLRLALRPSRSTLRASRSAPRPPRLAPQFPPDVPTPNLCCYPKYHANASPFPRRDPRLARRRHGMRRQQSIDGERMRSNIRHALRKVCAGNAPDQRGFAHAPALRAGVRARARPPGDELDRRPGVGLRRRLWCSRVPRLQCPRRVQRSRDARRWNPVCNIDAVPEQLVLEIELGPGRGLGHSRLRHVRCADPGRSAVWRYRQRPMRSEFTLRNGDHAAVLRCRDRGRCRVELQPSALQSGSFLQPHDDVVRFPGRSGRRVHRHDRLHVSPRVFGNAAESDLPESPAGRRAVHD